MSEEVIRKAKEQGYRGFQLYEIRIADMDGIDILKYITPAYSSLQIEQIRLGLAENIDISPYADPKMPPKQMEKVRNWIKENSGKIQLEKQKAKQDRWKLFLRVLVTAVLLGLCGGLLFYIRPLLPDLNQNIELELKETEVTLEYGAQFNSSDYIESVSQEDNVRIILPEDIDTAEPGSQTAVYKATNGIKTVTKTMVINVVDTTPPALTLKTSKYLLKAGELFSCKAFIDSANDNADGDLSEQVICETLDPDLEKQKIHYEVTDSSGNKSETSLLVMIEPLMKADKEESTDSENTDNPQTGEISEPTAVPAAAPTPVPATPQPAEPQQPLPEPQEAEVYDETYSYEENGGVTTCTVHHENGKTVQSCEWEGPWEEY